MREFTHTRAVVATAPEDACSRIAGEGCIRTFGSKTVQNCPQLLPDCSSDMLRTSPPPPNAKQGTESPSNGSDQRHNHPQDDRQGQHLPLHLSLPFGDLRIDRGRLWGAKHRVVQSLGGFPGFL